MSHCAIFGCNNTRKNTQNVKFFRFPVAEYYAKKWAISCKRSDDINTKTTRICSAHFKQDDYFKSLKERMLQYSPKNVRKLRADAVPSLMLPSSGPETEGSENRQKRHNIRVRKRLLKEILQESDTPSSSPRKIPRTDDDTSFAHPEENFTQAVPDDTVQKLQDRIKELETQVKEVLLQNQNLEKDKCSLKEELETLKLHDKKNIAVEVEKILSRYFTPGQIYCMTHKEKRIRWSADDIAAAISLKSVSAKAYRYLRNKLKYPLPDISTLRKWAREFCCESGILHNAIALMKSKAKDLSLFDKITVLSFDEVKISSEICVDKKAGQILGPHKFAQVAMARSLLGNWKQPIYYDFDKPMTEHTLKFLINALQEIDFQVVAVVSDMGGGNRAVWRQLGINTNKTYFQHPSDNKKKVFVFADVPHLLKLARNHFLDKGFVTNNGEIIDKAFIQNLLEQSQHDLKLTPKLSQHHLDVKGYARQKVKTAAQLLSNSVYQALVFLDMKDAGLGNSAATSDFIKMFNDWFDVMNSSRPADGYGSHRTTQDTILNNMVSFIETVRAKGVKNKLPFQDGIQISCKSLQNLFEYLNTFLPLHYITTMKLNQDILESFFSYIRGMGHQNNHPTPVDFKYRVRNYIMGKHSAAVFSLKTNTEDRPDESCITSTNSQRPQQKIELLLQKEMAVTCKLQPEENNSTLSVTVEWDERELPNENLSNEGLKFIAGYVAYRFKNKYPDLGDQSDAVQSSWINQLSQGGLVIPSTKFLDAIIIAEQRFINLHGEYFSKTRNVFEMLTNDIIDKVENVPKEVIQCFVRTRTYIRVRELNRKMRNYENEKRKLRTKMKKICQ